jgi:hypothetical protein
MKCAFCGNKDMTDIVQVPVWFPGSEDEPFACLECSKAKGLFCEKHNKSYMIFDGKTTACLFCIEELVGHEEHRAYEIVSKICSNLPAEELAKLFEAVQMAVLITGEDEGIVMLRFVASRAKRNHISVDEVVEQIVKTASANFIIGE